MVAYKLCRILKSGEITSLFINKTRRIPFNKWLEAESHPTKGYKYRPFWHCMQKPEAPHLSPKNRVWVKVEIKEFTSIHRPEAQGGSWYLANKVKFLKIIE